MSLKVIGGDLKGKPLASPKGRAVRPTAGRVREAIFNILHTRIGNAIVLDLFAGSGALGIEALSRGAGRVVFVENSPAALETIKQNINKCGLESAALILREDATRRLTGLSAFGLMFDIVFMDPPYDRDAIRGVLVALAETRLLKTGCLIIIEHSPRELTEEGADGFNLVDRRKYGKTIVSFLKYMVHQ